MPVNAACPRCRAGLSLNDDQARTDFRCPECGSTFRPTVTDSDPKRSTVGPNVSAPAGAPGPAVSAPPASSQKKLIGPFEIRRELGRGAFGVVFQAYDPALNRELAIKVLNRQALASKEAVDRFLREARVVAQMHHNNIVPVYQLGEYAGNHYIASKFIPGQVLDNAIPEQGLDAARAADLVIQLLNALDYAHDLKVLHRDVKPSNVVLDEKGQLYLMDFGLAGWVDENANRMTQVGQVVGTPAYMAPEQAEAKTAEVSFAADQYSAGVVLFELLTGRLPFDAPAQVLAYHVIHTPPPRPSEVRPGLDPRLDEICLKAMAKKPADRFPSCRAFADTLQAWRSGTKPNFFQAPTIPPRNSGVMPGPPGPAGPSKSQILAAPTVPPRPSRTFPPPRQSGTFPAAPRSTAPVPPAPNRPGTAHPRPADPRAGHAPRPARPAAGPPAKDGLSGGTLVVIILLVCIGLPALLAGGIFCYQMLTRPRPTPGNEGFLKSRN